MNGQMKFCGQREVSDMVGRGGFWKAGCTWVVGLKDKDPRRVGVVEMCDASYTDVLCSTVFD